MDRYLFSSPDLNVAVLWDGEKARQIDLNPRLTDSYAKKNPPQIKRFFSDLTEYLSGKEVVFSLPVDMGKFSPFARKVSDTVMETKPGEKLSYSELARRAGRPSAARAVGRVMARNPFPLVIPCHRVVGSDGSMTGYSAGLETKQRLLELEARIADNNRRTNE